MVSEYINMDEVVAMFARVQPMGCYKSTYPPEFVPVTERHDSPSSFFLTPMRLSISIQKRG